MFISSRRVCFSRHQAAAPRNKKNSKQTKVRILCGPLESRSNSEYTSMMSPKIGQKERLEVEVKKVLQQKGLWNDDLWHEIPKRWEKYGNMVIFNSNKYFTSPVWEKAGSDLWENVCQKLRCSRIGFKSCIQSNGFRSPKAKLVYGDSPWVDHTDNKIRYSWNVTRCMFAAGNAPERHRIAGFDCSNETVVDMYAGIGYFTLPFLVHAGAKLVYACEWNPDALEALRLNLQKNGVEDRCVVLEGDNRKVCPVNIADRVNLGLLPSSQQGWRTACLALHTSTGGVLHIHENITSGTNKLLAGADSTKQYFLQYVNKYLDSCKTCSEVVLVSDNGENTSILNVDFFQCFSHKHTHVSTILDGRTISWKKSEWRLCAFHVCHTIWNTLQEISEASHSNAIWKISVTNLHYVKSYAPHVDHLVLDLKCVPCKSELAENVNAC